MFGNENREPKDVSGGWYDAGDYGKYAVNGAYSVSLMLLTGFLAPDVLVHPVATLAEGDLELPDWMQVAEAELAWLLKMQAPDGGVYHKVASKQFAGMDVRPSDDNAQKWLMPVTSTATADFTAAMALAAMVHRKLSGNRTDQRAMLYERAAERAMHWLRKNPVLKMPLFESDGFSYSGPCHDDDDRDERFFAAAAFAAMKGRAGMTGHFRRMLAERIPGTRQKYFCT